MRIRHITTITSISAGVLLVILLVAASGLMLAQYVYQTDTVQTEMNQTLALVAESLLQTQLALQSLQGDFASFKDDTGQKFSETANSLSSATNATNQLRRQLVASIEPKLERVVETWQPRVARISCIVVNGNTLVRQTGAGTLFLSKGQPIFLTNKHVVSGGTVTACTYELPELKVSGTLDMTSAYTHPDGVDYVEVAVKEGLDNINLSNLSAGAMCTDTAKTGDQIAVLGFPQTGTQSASTLTEGVVSAYEDGLYVTSAKVEKGNSGGAAIDVNHNCYLGIPTFVAVGSFETLARVLDVPKLLEKE